MPARRIGPGTHFLAFCEPLLSALCWVAVAAKAKIEDRHNAENASWYTDPAQRAGKHGRAEK